MGWCGAGLHGVGAVPTVARDSVYSCVLRRGSEWELLHFLGWASSCPPQLEPVVRPLEPEAGDFPAGIASVLARDSLP